MTRPLTAPARREGKSRKKLGKELLAEFSPGKKGGEFELPFGGRLIVPNGALARRDVITCCQVSPSDRHKFCPILREGEELLSEIYIIGTNDRECRRSLELILPIRSRPYENMYETDVIMRAPDHDSWQSIDFDQDGPKMYFTSDIGGVYVAISRPKREYFVVPAQGCLYNSKLSHQISVRIPKKSTQVDVEATITISPMNRQLLPLLAENYPSEMSDVLAITDYVTVETLEPATFKRALSVKLPLPMIEGEFNEEDIGVLTLEEGRWVLIEKNMKFTRSSIVFDVLHLGKYCVALATQNRARRLTNALNRIHAEDRSTRGVVMSFLHVQDKMWTLMIDLVKNEGVEALLKKRESEGFQRQHTFESMSEVGGDLEPRKRLGNAVKREDLDLRHGQAFDFEMDGDIVVQRDPNNSHKGLFFHPFLEANYRKVMLEPRESEIRNDSEVSSYAGLNSTLHIYTPTMLTSATAPMTAQGRKCVKMFDIDLPAENVRNFLYEPIVITPPPEPVKPEVTMVTAPEVMVREVEVEVPKPMQHLALPGPRKPAQQSLETFKRLTTLKRPKIQISKEPKVLSGRSLRNLAQEIEHGLTLAIYLDISDSSITGLGFDALASGQSLSEITYRILLLWKRQTRDKTGPGQVELLMRALEDMGRSDVAKIVQDQNNMDREITRECFFQAATVEESVQEQQLPPIPV